MPETAQPAPETDEKKSRGLGSYVFWGFVVVMVYVLSSGPMIGLYESKRVPGNAVIVYRPLGEIYKHTFLHKPIGMYWHLWCPAMFDPQGRFVPELP